MNTSTTSTSNPAPSRLGTDSLTVYVEASRAFGTVSLRIGPPDSTPMGLRAAFDLSPDAARALAGLLIAHAAGLEALS